MRFLAPPVTSNAAIATALVLIAVAACIGCGAAMNSPSASASSVANTVSFTSGAVSATGHPLVARYSFTSPVAANVAVEFGPDTTYGRSTSAQAVGAGQTVNILVAGMRASSTYHMRAFVQYAGGSYRDSDHTFSTGAPPAAAVPLTLATRAAGATPTSGVELLDLAVPNGQFETIATDLDGNLIWYYAYQAGPGANPIRLMPNGNLFVLVGPNDAREIDLAGNTLQELTPDVLNTRLAAAGSVLRVAHFHHDTLPLANGHIVLLCELTKVFSGVTGSVGPVTVSGDVLVDVDSKMNPGWTWSAFDHLDVNRHPMDIEDWTHGNALLYSPADGTLLFSMRNQHCVLKIDYGNGQGTGNVIWRLGSGGDFTLLGGNEQDWCFGQHFPTFAGNASAGVFPLALFDNRAASNDGSVCATTSNVCYSRPLILNLDETARTATVAWDHALELYSFWGGNMSAFGNGKIEYTLSNPFPGLGARAVEESRDSRQLVWQLDIIGQLAYRAYRIPSLYPGVQW